MGESTVNKDTKARTNAGKAKELLKRHGLYGNDEVFATKTTLKVLFGKGGVLRLLNEALVSSPLESMFESMSHTLIARYQKLKYENTEIPDGQTLENIEKLDNSLANVSNNDGKSLKELEKKIGEVIESYSDKAFESLGQTAMQYKEKIKRLKKEIRELEDAAADERAKARNKRSDARKVLGGGVIAEIATTGVGAKNRANAARYSAQANKLRVNQWNIFENEQKLFENTNNLVTGMRRVIKGQQRKWKAEIQGLDAFCKLCNTLGEKYYDQKMTGIFSFNTNKVKKEVARILMKIGPPK